MPSGHIQPCCFHFPDLKGRKRRSRLAISTLTPPPTGPASRTAESTCSNETCLFCAALASKAHSCPHMVPRLAPSSCKHVSFQPSNPNRYFILFLNLHFKVLGWFQFICFGQTFSLEPIRLPDKTQNFWFFKVQLQVSHFLAWQYSRHTCIKK